MATSDPCVLRSWINRYIGGFQHVSHWEFEIVQMEPGDVGKHHPGIFMHITA